MLYKKTNWDKNTKKKEYNWKVLELSISRKHGFFDRKF
jgi:hypothetical protein